MLTFVKTHCVLIATRVFDEMLEIDKDVAEAPRSQHEGGCPARS